MTRGDPRLPSPTDVAHHLACQHRTQLERQRLAGTLKVSFVPDARLEAMKVRGEEHERRYVESLRAAGRTITDLRGIRDPAATLAAMRAGADAIVQAPLRSDTFAGIADVLLRTATPSSLGAHSYEPVDTKLAVETKAGALLQLLTYCELLRDLQGTLPARFLVVTPRAEEPYRTADYAAYYRVVRDHLRHARAAEPPPSTYPEPVPLCEICAYWQHCERRRRTDDHPSLIAGIQRMHVQELQRQGLPTLAAFAAAGRLPAAPQRGSADTYERLAHQAQLQLQARTCAQPPVERLPLEPGRGLHRLPAPSPGDVFLDFEGDPFVAEAGLEYLTGYCHRAADGRLDYEQHWALDHAAERNALETCLDFLAARLRAHPDLHVYHFGAYEVAALRRLCARHDTRGATLDELLRGERFVDLHTLVREAFRIGVESYGLKELEKVAGYARQLDLRAAGVARRDLELHLELGREAQITAALREQVAAYNRDDCLATAHLRDWLEQQLTAAVAGGAEIPRPVLRAGEANQAVGEREARVNAVREALVRDLPPADDRDDEHRARALLADLAGYFRREAKSAWWEHFRLRELPREEHLDEREMLAGLEHVRVIPKRGRQQLDRDEFRFPAQECAIDGNDESLVFTRLEDPAVEGTGTAVAIETVDLAAGTITLQLPADVQGARPTALFRKPFIAPDDVEDALLVLCEQVRDQGLDGAAHGPAVDLLLRRLPRTSTPMPMRQSGENTIDALVRLCRGLDGGVLPVQGPPGTGKSHTGARAILALAADGKRIGVIAVSHKVIDNLLEKVLDAAKEEQRKVAVVHVDRRTGHNGITRITPNKALDALDGGKVVGATVYFWAKEAASAKLDYLFVDEAGQMSLAAVLAGARATRNLILLGDPQQLEQPHKGTHPDGADVAALTHLIGTGRATVGDDQGLFLGETFRLHPSLCAFTSELYYDHRLAPVEGCSRQRIDGTGIVDGAGMFLLECAHSGNQASAREEVAAVAALVRSILQPAATWTDRAGRTERLTGRHVLVIAPYNAQVGELRRSLADLGVTEIGTVDRFQGREAPVVVYSCTSSSPQDAPRGLAFLFDPHRLNVATSRAQCAFVMVASPALFAPEVRTPEQMRWANGMCRFREVAQPIRL